MTERLTRLGMRLVYLFFEGRPPKPQPALYSVPQKAAVSTMLMHCEGQHTVAATLGMATLVVGCTRTDRHETGHRAIIETSTAKYTVEWN